MTRKIKITNTKYPNTVPNGTIMTVIGLEPNGCVNAVKDGDDFPWFIDAGTFHVLDDTPTLWRDMTDAEKSALLLAKHEGKIIENNECGEWKDCYPVWGSGVAYRVKPEPVRDTVTMYGNNYAGKIAWTFGLEKDSSDTHTITFDTVGGTPDTSSIRMEAL